MGRKNEPEEIFNKAVELSDPAQQAAYLDQACGGNEKLRAQVEALLQWHQEAGSFLDGPAVEPELTRTYAGPEEHPGMVVGRYKLLEKIGEGGMATVYMAEQEEPVRRKVAFKIIKLGMDSREVVARFEAERQALALMDHPNIAKVFDAGLTEAGRPYFVMELVRGIAITEYCDQNKLSTAERLQLFLQVCQAVQHAHQKGVIHRDIKPSNILVTLHDGRPQAVVIDFGIAKATSQRLTEKTLFTRYAQLIGTPEYMSPEQAEMSRLDVDTRTDIYSLGVLLYELLTGSTPFDAEQLRQAGYAGIQRIIRETEPPKPSTKLSTLGKNLSEVAMTRRTTPEALSRLVRGDLDWIVMKALEKDRTRRYETAHALVEDIERHLRDEPISAGRPSAFHRGRKFVRRNRALVTGTSTVLVVLIAGIIGMAVFAMRAVRAENEALTVVTFIDQDLLGAVARLQAVGQQVTVRSILDAATIQLEGRFTNKPLVEATIRQTLGRTYIELGLYREAEPHLERAYDVRHRLLGDNDLLTLASMAQLGRLYEMEGRFREAEPLLAQALESRRHILGPDHRDTLENSAWLGGLYAARPTTPELVEQAGKLLTATLESGTRILGREDPIVLEALYGLACLRGEVQGEMICREGCEVSKKVLGEGHRLTCRFMTLAAMFAASAGQFEDAIRHADAAWKVNESIRGKEHHETLRAKCTLGVVHARQYNLEEAEDLLGSGIEALRRALKERNTEVFFYSRELACVYLYQGRYQEARDLLKRTIEEEGRLLGVDHVFLMPARALMMFSYAMQEDADKLEKWCQQQIESLEGKSGDHRLTLACVWGGLAWLQATYPSSAIRNGDKAIENATKTCELIELQSSSVIDTLAAAYAASGNLAEAVAQEKKAIDTSARPDDVFGCPPEVLRYNLRLYESNSVPRESYLTMLARRKIAEGKYEAAEQELTAKIGVARRYLDRGETHPETLGCILAFIELYEAWGKPDKVAAWRAQLPPRGSPPEW
jgi:serine/threonine protein kinase